MLPQQQQDTCQRHDLSIESNSWFSDLSNLLNSVNSVQFRENSIKYTRCKNNFTQGQIEHTKNWDLKILWVFSCPVQSDVKKIILVKSSLCKVRFNPCEVTFSEVMSHQCNYSLVDIYLLIQAYPFFT